MKCIILFTIVALCHSYPYGTGFGKSVITEDGTIVVPGAGGKRITINKSIGSFGQKTVDITVSGPFIPSKWIQINAEDLHNQPTCLQLLNEINRAVQDEQLSSSVYDVLQGLNNSPLEQERSWIWQQGTIGGQNQVGALNLLSRLGQQSQIAVGVPIGVDNQGQQIIGKVVIPMSQATTGLGLWGLSNTRGLGVSGQQGLSGITGIPRTPWGITGLLTPAQLAQARVSQVRGIGEPVSAKLEEVIENEREILNEQSQIQQQQLLQQHQQQELLAQQLTQQVKQQQQQLQQQVLQQLQQQQLQQQEAVLGQQKQEMIWGNSRLNGGWSGIQNRGQVLWQQQPALSSQRGLWTGSGQGVPVISGRGVPMMI